MQEEQAYAFTLVPFLCPRGVIFASLSKHSSTHQYLWVPHNRAKGPQGYFSPFPPCITVSMWIAPCPLLNGAPIGTRDNITLLDSAQRKTKQSPSTEGMREFTSYHDPWIEGQWLFSRSLAYLPVQHTGWVRTLCVRTLHLVWRKSEATFDWISPLVCQAAKYCLLKFGSSSPGPQVSHHVPYNPF